MTPNASEPSLDEVLTALRSSHDRLVASLAALTDEQISGPSYDDDWTLAQVCSHLGSQAEIFGMFIDAGVRQEPAPGMEEFQAVWDRWNAKPADEQARDAVTAEHAFLERVQEIPSEERERWRLDMFGSEQSLAGLLRMRLAEHSLHTWDVRVVADDSEMLPDAATELIVDNLPGLVERVGKGAPNPLTVQVRTTGPERTFLLHLTNQSAALTSDSASPAGPTAELRLPSEAFVRLIYGRLDPEHTPDSVESDGVHLDTLRAAFPGV
jgi:uncharacterized protein (TIGR03083 family)